MKPHKRWLGKADLSGHSLRIAFSLEKTPMFLIRYEAAANSKLYRSRGRDGAIDGAAIALAWRCGGAVLAKRVELLKEVMPRLERLLLVFDPADPVSLQELATVRAAANGLRLQVVERAARTTADIQRVFTQANREHIQAVVVVSGLITRFGLAPVS